MASQRKRLGVSAAECGLLIGASAQSVYNWQEGKARPRAAFGAADPVARVAPATPDGSSPDSSCPKTQVGAAQLAAIAWRCMNSSSA